MGAPFTSQWLGESGFAQKVARERLFQEERSHLAVPFASLGNLTDHDNVDKSRVVAVLVTCVIDRLIDVHQHIGCAEALRRTVLSPLVLTGRALALDAQRVITRVSTKVDPSGDALVMAAIVHIEAALMTGTRPTREMTARGLATTAGDLDSRMRLETGMSLVQWRSCLAMRLSVSRLGHSTEHVAQIAYSVGFEHPAQLSREFRRTFGMAPKQLRDVLSGADNHNGLGVSSAR